MYVSYQRGQETTQGGRMLPAGALVPCPPEAMRRRRRRGLGATATTSAGFFSGNAAAPNGIPPGSACYDNSFSPGMIHGAPEIGAWALSDATDQISAAETACLAGQLATIPPPSVPTVDPSTGLLVPGVSPPSTSLLGPTETSGLCPFYCYIPGSSIFDPTYSSDCAACSSNGLMIGGLALAGIALLFVVQMVRK